MEIIRKIITIFLRIIHATEPLLKIASHGGKALGLFSMILCGLIVIPTPFSDTVFRLALYGSIATLHIIPGLILLQLVFIWHTRQELRDIRTEDAAVQ